MFPERTTTLFLILIALLFAPSTLAKPMPALPSGLASRANHKRAQVVGHSTKPINTYKGTHLGAAKHTAKSKSIARSIHRRQAVEDAVAAAEDLPVDDAETAAEGTTDDDTVNIEDVDTTIEAVDGEAAIPSRRQDDTTEQTTDAGTTDGATGTEDSTPTIKDDVADVEEAAIKKKQAAAAAEVDAVETTDDAVEDVNDDTLNGQGSLAAARDDVEEAPLDGRQYEDESDTEISSNISDIVSRDTEKNIVDRTIAALLGFYSKLNDLLTRVLDDSNKTRTSVPPLVGDAVTKPLGEATVNGAVNKETSDLKNWTSMAVTELPQYGGEYGKEASTAVQNLEEEATAP